MNQKQKPFRSRAYLDWVKVQPRVWVTHPRYDPFFGLVDAHHIKGRGFGGTVKCSDLFTIPILRIHHQELHSTGWKSWEKTYGVNQADVCFHTLKQAQKKFPQFSVEIVEAMLHLRRILKQEKDQ